VWSEIQLAQEEDFVSTIVNLPTPYEKYEISSPRERFFQVLKDSAPWILPWALVSETPNFNSTDPTRIYGKREVMCSISHAPPPHRSSGDDIKQCPYPDKI
jgi:hypothetical protein